MSTSHGFYIMLSYSACVVIIAFLVCRSAYSYFKTRNQLKQSDNIRI